MCEFYPFLYLYFKLNAKSALNKSFLLFILFLIYLKDKETIKGGEKEFFYNEFAPQILIAFKMGHTETRNIRVFHMGIRSQALDLLTNAFQFVH